MTYFIINNESAIMISLLLLALICFIIFIMNMISIRSTSNSTPLVLALIVFIIIPANLVLCSKQKPNEQKKASNKINTYLTDPVINEYLDLTPLEYETVGYVKNFKSMAKNFNGNIGLGIGLDGKVQPAITPNNSIHSYPINDDNPTSTISDNSDMDLNINDKTIPYNKKTETFEYQTGNTLFEYHKGDVIINNDEYFEVKNLIDYLNSQNIQLEPGTLSKKDNIYTGVNKKTNKEVNIEINKSKFKIKEV